MKYKLPKSATTIATPRPNADIVLTIRDAAALVGMTHDDFISWSGKHVGRLIQATQLTKSVGDGYSLKITGVRITAKELVRVRSAVESVPADDLEYRDKLEKALVDSAVKFNRTIPRKAYCDLLKCVITEGRLKPGDEGYGKHMVF